MSTKVFFAQLHCNSFAVGTTCEHLGFCIALRVPTLVVVSKVDLCSQQIVDQTVSQLEELLTSPGCRKTPRVIRTENDAYTTAQQLNELSFTFYNNFYCHSPL